MTERQKIVLQTVVEDGTKPGFDSTARGAAEMAQAVAASSGKASDAVKGVGDEADASAQKFDKATRSIASAVQRATQEQQKLRAVIQSDPAGSASPEYFNRLTQNLGANAAQLQPLIDGLRTVRSEVERLRAVEQEAGAAALFEKQHQASRLLLKDAEYVRFWTDELKRLDAIEEQAGATALFEKEHQAARLLVRDAEYVRFWTDELKRLDAVEQQFATRTAFVDSLKKQSQAIGKTRADLLELRAAEIGASKDAAPFIAKIREFDIASGAAANGVTVLGRSAKATAAALRQVPAQFTDIIVSLQGGQAPLQVLLQQGGQLKDVFGGIAPAAKALGGFILGLINPFTLAAGAAAALATAYNIGSKEADAYNKALILTGNAAGTTAGQLQLYAQQIDASVGTQGKAAEALAAFAASGAVGAENLKSFAEGAIRFERATGTAIDETVKKFVQLRDAPLQASIDLNKTTGFLTESLYQQIRALEGQGRATEAAVVAQKAFNDAQLDRSDKITDNLGSIERGWKAITSAIKEAADAALNVGRATSEASKLPGIQADIASRERLLAFGRVAPRNRKDPLSNLERAQTTLQLEGLRAQEAAIIARESKAQAVADAERRRVESVRASQAFDKSGERFQDPRDKLNRELAEAVNQGKAAGRSQQEIDARTNAIRADFSKKNKVNTTEENKALKDQQAVYAALAGVSSTYYAELANAQKQRAAGLVTEAQYVQLVEQLILKQPFAVALDKERTEAVKQRQKAEEEALKIDNDALEVRQRSGDAVREQVLRLKDEEKASIIAARRNISLAEAIGEVELARLQDERAQLSAAGASDATLLAVDQEIAARRDLIRLVASKEAREVNEKAAKDAAAEWKRTADSISDSLTDALLRGFESGKGFLRNLVDTAKNLFATLVLRPQIQAAFGIGGAAASGGASANGGGGFSPGSITGLFGGNSVGAGIGGGLVDAGNFFVNAGFDKFGAAVSSFADGAASFSNTSYGLAGIAGGFIGKLLFNGRGQSTLGGSLGATAGLALSGTVAAGGAAAGAAAGASAGSVVPVVGTIIGAVIGAALGSLIGGKQPYFQGAAFQAQASGAGFAPTDRAFFQSRIPEIGKAGFADYTKRATVQFQDATKTLATGLQDIYGGLLDSFGKSAQEQDIFVAFRSNGKKADGTISVGGTRSVLKTGENDPNKAFQQFSNTAARAVLDAVGKVGVPAYAKKLLDEVAKAPGIEALNAVVATLAQIRAVTDSIRALPFTNLKTISEESVIALSELTGGLQNLGTAVSTYYTAFYSAEEQRAEAQRRITAEFAKLGVALPSSNAAFRALVTAQDLSTDAGRKLYAQLLTLSPAFAGLTAATDQFRESVRGVTDGLVAEAQRIRGTAGIQTLSGAQSAFAIATASARAGSQDAAKTLPGLSQTLLELAEQNATSAQSLASIRAQTANSLDATAAALSAKLGVPFTGAVVQAALPLTQNSRSTTDDTLAALKAMQAEFVAMRAAAELTAANTRQTSDTLRRVTQDGDALVTTPL